MEGTFIDGNKAAQRITGYQKEELVGKNFFQRNIPPPHEISKAQQALAINKQGFATGPDEFTLYRKDQKKIAVEIFTYPIKIKDKPLVLAISRDITQRKKAEGSLRKSDERFRVAFNNSPSNRVQYFKIHRFFLPRS
jgi:PAS domain S-box-containing protein